MSRAVLAAIVAAFALFILASASLFTVQQTEQVLITQFGQPIRVINTPGLHVRVPFVQQVISFDRRLLDYETPGEEIILNDQRRLIVDSFTRFRITDPLRYFQAVGAAEDAIRARLNSVVTSSLRRVLGGETLLNVLSNDRGRIMGLIREQVAGEMRSTSAPRCSRRMPSRHTPTMNVRVNAARSRSASLWPVRPASEVATSKAIVDVVEKLSVRAPPRTAYSSIGAMHV